jgi:hypothetical protein
VFLRAADAIHQATAAEFGFRIVYSNDAHLVGAAKYFGIEGEMYLAKRFEQKQVLGLTAFLGGCAPIIGVDGSC